MPAEERGRIAAPLFLKFGTPLQPPRNFCLDENFEEVANFLAILRALGRVSLSRHFAPGKERQLEWAARRLYYTDFRCIERITPAAALVLAAEYDRARRLADFPMFTIKLDEWNLNVRRSLQEVGFLDLLDVVAGDFPSPVEERDGEVIQPFVTGRQANPEKIDEMAQALDKLAGVLNADTEVKLNSAVGEAMINVRQHAYPEWHSFENPVTRQWWMTGSANARAHRLKIIIYDQGVSIPIHLPRTRTEDLKVYWMNTLGRLFGEGERVDDGDMIKAATEIDRTSSKSQGQGKGFKDMLDAVDSSPNGKLRILSRMGEYLYETGSHVTILNHNVSIGGTLIEWEIWS